MGFPGGSVVKNSHANAGDTRDLGSSPVLGRSPGIGNGNPLKYSCLEEPGRLWQWVGHDWVTHLWAHTHYHPHSCWEWRTDCKPNKGPQGLCHSVLTVLLASVNLMLYHRSTCSCWTHRGLDKPIICLSHLALASHLTCHAPTCSSRRVLYHFKYKPANSEPAAPSFSFIRRSLILQTTIYPRECLNLS